MNELSCFKAYDIRGKLGEEFNTTIAYNIGRAIAEFLKPERFVVGGDNRLSTNEIKEALSQGLLKSGVDVIDIGLTGSEEVYYATQYLDVNGGVEVTASHNPIDFNGMKLVRSNGQPISSDSGLLEIKKFTEKRKFSISDKKGKYYKKSILDNYVSHILSYISLEKLKPLKIVINSGNGSAGHVINRIEEVFRSKNIPINIIKIHNEPDGKFPNGIPNPLLPENRKDTVNAVLKHKADLGVAFDGDFDRCFLFDEKGNFIEGYYIVGLLSEVFLKKEPKAKIIHDPRLYWNTLNVINDFGGTAIMSKTGHAFIKERMRLENAVYGGEMSAHHYFRDFCYCDSGMIPWLIVIELLSIQKLPLSYLVQDRVALFPSSGEINIKTPNPQNTLKEVSETYSQVALNIDYTDGISMEFEEWRFNLRSSNTEPVIRLNVESKNNINLLYEKTEEILNIIENN